MNKAAHKVTQLTVILSALFLSVGYLGLSSMATFVCGYFVAVVIEIWDTVIK